MDAETQHSRLRVAWVGVFVLGLVAAGLMLPRFMDDEGEEPAVAAVPTAVETPTPPTVVASSPTAAPESTPTPNVTATPTPTPVPAPTAIPTPTPTVGPDQTVLFRGGPAQGPWQQLGTVAEITHPDAPPSARYSYTNFWADPEEENQPDELWDQLAKEVTDQLVELGEPVDRPAFGGAEGSEPFNSFGGLQDIYFDDEAFTASWSGVFEDSEGVAEASFWYIISFEGNIEARFGPVLVRGESSRTVEDNAQSNVSGIRAWSQQKGLLGCSTC